MSHVLFREVGERPLVFPDLGCDVVTPGMKVPERAMLVMLLFCGTSCAFTTCVLFVTGAFLYQARFVCVIFLFFKFSELSSVTQSVGEFQSQACPGVARPGLVHTGGPWRTAGPAPALQVCFPRGPPSRSPRHPCLPSPAHRIPSIAF